MEPPYLNTTYNVALILDTTRTETSSVLNDIWNTILQLDNYYYHKNAEEYTVNNCFGSFTNDRDAAQLDLEPD